jgi:hypothetical protein
MIFWGLIGLKLSGYQQVLVMAGGEVAVIVQWTGKKGAIPLPQLA